MRQQIIREKYVEQQRWTFAVGQGLLHYEEIRVIPYGCRPITIVYDAGSFSKRKNKNDTAYQSIEEVNSRLARCNRTIDYLVLSHFHADHYNLMGRLLKENKVRHFVAPLLTPKDNSVEIAALAYKWFSDKRYSNGNEDGIRLIAALAERGTGGFCEELFREYEKPDQFIYITNESGRNDNDEPIIDVIPGESDGNGRSQNEDSTKNGNGNSNTRIISHSRPILIADKNKYYPFWKMAFYCNTPGINPPKYWDAAKKELNNQLKVVLNKCSGNSDEIEKQFKEIFSKKTYLPYKDEDSSDTEKKRVKFKDVFGYANVNMTSLTMYSGYDLQDTNLEIRTFLVRHPYRYWPNPRFELEHEVANLLVHTARETSNKKRQSLIESFTSQSIREDILAHLYPDSNLFYTPLHSERHKGNLYWHYVYRRSNTISQSYKQPFPERNFFWSWIGFGDMNFEDAAVADNLIKHFEKQGGLLGKVGCCLAPHHGSHNGFATAKIPSRLEGAVCLISCDPNRVDFGHPRIEAVSSILKGGMLPILVSDQKQTTFHEVLRWPFTTSRNQANQT